MRWLLNVVYCGLLLLLSPVILWRSARHGRYRRGLSQKIFGRLPQTPGDLPVAWFHAVSVGEVVQLEKIVGQFRKQTGSAYRIVVTSSTDTGYDLAVKRFSDADVSWFPLDFSWAVSRALQNVRPAIVVLMELELWPNFITECDRRGIQVAVINARMSDHSVRGYLRIRPFIASVLRRLSLVAAQSQQYAERLISLGANPQCVFVTGSIKFDGVSTDPANEQTSRLRVLLGLQENDVVFIAGSTQAPEEQIALNAWQQLKENHPQLRMILVPRHKERFDEVAELCRQAGVSLLRRSAISAKRSEKSLPPIPLEERPVILLDTIGELSACWGLADMAFVGGSFGSRGGQNMIEPAGYGAVVMFGPNTSNFRDVVAAFRQAEACIRLEQPSELADVLHTLYENPELCQRLGEKARNVVIAQQGATELTCQLLCRQLDQSLVVGIPETVFQRAAA
jgi:3-deoxy-D-manno-octulosonic-acid transferase